MKFEVDDQTKKDLEIFDTSKSGVSIFGLFNFTRCIGGRRRLYEFLSSPLADIDEIKERKEAIAFFHKYFPDGLDVDKNSLDFTEYYLRQPNHPTRMPSRFTAIERKIVQKFTSGAEYYLVEKGVESTVNLLRTIYAFSLALAGKFKTDNTPVILKNGSDEVLKLFSRPDFGDIIKLKRLRAYDIFKLDYMFRYTERKNIQFFLKLIYEYDAFFSISKAARVHNFIFPELVTKIGNVLDIEGLSHPFVKDAIPNDIRFDETSNLLFISGPNMAGKSTFLKSLGLSVYLAHAGFPVPATKMKFSILSGLCTTINISDNLSSGYSHFYAEVMRIKNVALKLQTNKNMLVLFDELFRGTNVKDAYDGTLAIVSAFAKIRTSFFVISTHIVEVAKELANKKNIQFAYFEIKQENGHPVYTYKIKEGVSEDRLGMYIIRKEGLIDLINEINKQ